MDEHPPEGGPDEGQGRLRGSMGRRDGEGDAPAAPPPPAAPAPQGPTTWGGTTPPPASEATVAGYPVPGSPDDPYATAPAGYPAPPPPSGGAAPPPGTPAAPGTPPPFAAAPPPPGAPDPYAAGGYGTPAQGAAPGYGTPPPPGGVPPGTGGYPAQGGYPGQPAPPAGEGGGRKIPTPVLLAVGAVLLLVVLAAGAAVIANLLGGDDGGSAIEGIDYEVEAGPTGQPDEEPKVTLDVDCDVDCDIGAWGSRFFVATDQEPNDEGNVDVEVMAYDAGSGDEAWDSPVEVDASTDLGAFQDVVLVGSDTSTVALAADDGAELWEADGSVSGIIDDDTLVLSEFSDEDGTSTSRGVELISGDELWEVDGFVVPCGSRALAIDGSDLSMFDPSSGDESWSDDVGDVFDFGCDGDIVAVEGEDEEVTVLSAGDGEEVGTFDLPVDEGTLGVFDGDVFVAGEGDVTRIEGGGDFEEAWTGSGPDDAFQMYKVGGSLLIDGDGEMTAVAVSDGEDIGRVRSSDIVTDELTSESYLVADDDGIEAYELETLEDRWSLDVEDVSSIAIAGDRLVVLADDEVLVFA